MLDLEGCEDPQAEHNLKTTRDGTLLFKRSEPKPLARNDRRHLQCRNLRLNNSLWCRGPAFWFLESTPKDFTWAPQEASRYKARSRVLEYDSLASSTLSP
jgi:hypothetical protein